MWRDAALVAGRDLRIEGRSRVALSQVGPFALLILVLFAFALDPERGVLERATAGLFWVAVLLSAMLTLGRSAALDEADGVRDGLRLSGLEPGGIFLGKAVAVAAQLLALEVVLACGVVILYDADPTGIALLVATCLSATAAVAAAGTLYGALVSGLRVRETLLPLLVLPALAPVLIGATRAFESALGGVPSEGWPWCGLLAGFAVFYSLAGALAYGALLEGS
jgi:heme exporter protein B